MSDNAYAVIESGGKQHRVKVGQRCRLEKLVSELGSSVTFDNILMVANGEALKIGAPYVKGAIVTADVIAHGRAKKIRVIKFKRRKKYHRTQGHRQDFTEVKITQIQA
ncbi:MAG TPA: 50S ribosomal protein L21 [Gammaproteobacteria bacterium]|nr:50S ribosomal protein L21 [Gammaproteobacteria bacterium]